MRKGSDGLAAQVQAVLKTDPFSGHLFRGKHGDLLKAFWWDGQSLVLLAKRLKTGTLSGDDCARGLGDADDRAAGDAAGGPELAHSDAKLEA